MASLSGLPLRDDRRRRTAAAIAVATWARAQRARRGDGASADWVALSPAREAVEDDRLTEEGDLSPAERAGWWLRSLGPRAGRLTFGLATAVASVAALATLGVAVTTYRHGGDQEGTESSRQVEAPAPVAAAAAVPRGKTTGRLDISSQPPAARVLVDGAFRGTTPLTIDDLKHGEHVVVLESSEGSVSRVVTIADSNPVLLDERIFSGWVALYSPFDLAVREESRTLSLDDRHQLLLPAGPHELHLENRALGYEEVRRVDVKPGETLTLQVTPPRSDLTVTATGNAQVWVDGALAGDAPLVAFPVALGTHEVIARRAGDERRFIVTSTVKPVELTVDFSRP